MKENIIRLSKSCLSEKEINAVTDVLRREYLGMGENVKKFETDLSKYLGREAICVSSGTAALQLAIQSCDIGQGDEVIVQTLTYVASFQAISATGALPVACDICPETLTMDVSDAETRITEKTKALMPVYYAGGVGKLNDVYNLARKYDLRVIEDASHAFGSSYEGQLVGSFGDITCFSFDGIKNITSGEGGCVVTDDLRSKQRIMDARLLGVMKDTEKRFNGSRSWDFEVAEQGWRYHMSNIMAAIGAEQLKRSDSLFSKRQSLAKSYDSYLTTNDKLRVVKQNYSQIVPHIYPILLDASLDRDWVRSKLIKAGIETGVHYKPNHLLSFFRQNGRGLRNSNKLADSIISLPLHPDLEPHQVEYVCEKLGLIVQSNSDGYN